MASPTLHARDAAADADSNSAVHPQSSLQQPVSSSSPADPATPAAAVQDPTPAANPPPLNPSPSSSDPLDPPGTSTTIQDPSPSMASPPPDPSSAPDTTTSPPHPPPSSETQQTQPQPQPATTTLSASETRESKTSDPDPAIGPSSDVLTPSSAKESDDAAGGQSMVINLLLTTGARHPFKIDGKYLRKRQVEVPDGNPFAMSVYTLKELIWREWRSEWEPRPSSPGSIRLISFGKLLEDKSPLSDSRFTQDAPNVVHMTVKPQEVVDEEDAKANKASSGRDRDGGDPSPHCRCVIL
ncbi:hypothetical protein FQN50_005940 [Emmonsiellopsis sp. PD_5]|nr:hypothetical protein FQN50_005940 [Emmonsiellopsis sp. PD_5]